MQQCQRLSPAKAGILGTVGTLALHPLGDQPARGPEHYLSTRTPVWASANVSLRFAAARIASAPMVLVGFTAPPVGSTLPSMMYRFGTSQDWCHRFTTEVS